MISCVDYALLCIGITETQQGANDRSKNKFHLYISYIFIGQSYSDIIEASNDIVLHFGLYWPFSSGLTFYVNTNVNKYIWVTRRKMLIFA